MPSFPPPRRMRSDNIARWHVRDRKRVAAMIDVLRQVKGKTGPWLERDPNEAEAWWQAVLRDPRAQRTRMEHIPADHPDACLRLDRCPQPVVTVKCTACGVSAAYALDDLRKSFGADHSIMRLPVYLLPCKSKRDRREGACSLEAEPGGFMQGLRSVKSMGSI